MKSQVVGIGPLAAASANSVCLSQTPTAASNLTLNGSAASAGLVTFDGPRQVAITSAADDRGVLFSIEGWDGFGYQVGEQLKGGNGAAVRTNAEFLAITRIYTDRATAGAVTVGSAAAPFVSHAVRLDEWAQAPLAISCVVSGTANYSVQHSFDDPNDPEQVALGITPQNMNWDATLLPAGLTGATANQSTILAATPLWLRLLLNSGTGSVRMTATQYNVVNR